MKTYKSSDVVGTEIYGLGNPDLKWQETENYNVSLDFTMFRNILSAKVEYYEKYTIVRSTPFFLEILRP